MLETFALYYETGLQTGILTCGVSQRNATYNKQPRSSYRRIVPEDYTRVKTDPITADDSLLHSYLIRLYSDSRHEPWRATARRVSDGRELHFATLEQLFLYLHQQTTNHDK